MAKQTIRVCPECGSDDLYPETGFISGYQYHCNNCGYVGALVLEKDLDDHTADLAEQAAAEETAAGEEE